jgi:hypothetical protein
LPRTVGKSNAQFGRNWAQYIRSPAALQLDA